MMNTKKQLHKNHKKQLIINADDFGISEDVNNAIVDGYKNGVLASTTIMANAPAFEHAVLLLPELQGISLGVHLNIIEFSTLKTTLKNNSLLYDKDGIYNNGYIQLILKSFNKDFLNEVEEDFRLQIETVLSKTSVDHIDSHVHVHAIPNIFKIVCKLAKEYGIKHIRTQFEYPYFVPDIKKYLTTKYPVNWLKLLLLNSFTIINKKYLETIEGVTTNKNFVGVNYTGYMDKNTLLCALPFVSEETEAVLHPSINPAQPFHYNEYQTLIEREVIEKIQKSEIDLINFSGKTKF